jgi:glycine betaine/proline transport system permease protein
MHEILLADSDSWLPKIPIGNWASDIVNWLNDNIGPVFDFITAVVTTVVDAVTNALLWPPSYVIIIIFALLAFWLRGWKFALATAIGFGVVESIGVFDSAMTSLAQVLIAGIVATAIAIPLGILAARRTTASQILKPVMDFMQTLPAFVYLIPVIVLFSIGETSGVIATIVFSLPPGVRLTELGIRQVDKEMVEAGEAFGSPPRKILTEIQIPLAMPSIMAGVNQIIMLALSMVVISGMVGAPGLGSDVFGAVTRIDFPAGVEGGLGVVMLAIYLDRLTSALASHSQVARARSLAGAA